jgi:aminoglycoside 6'-N-acetyltransferase I
MPTPPTPTYLAARLYLPDDRAEWLRMRQRLWPNPDPEAQLTDMDKWLAQVDTIVLVVPRGGGASTALAGFAEVGTRSVADSCETSPVAYLEGWYVDEDLRRQGVGTALVRAAEAWALSKGLKEFASDTQLGNADSQLAHAALGFTEVERLVAYRKVLGPQGK